jgi:DNA-binding CsgD family transcriptional regulator
MPDYTLFHEFIKTFSPIGFRGVNFDDSRMIELEKSMEINNQFFFVCDLILMKILFTSKLSTKIIGVEPENINPYHFFEATHPDDIEKHSLARTKLFKLAQELFIGKGGTKMLSTNLKILGRDGKYKSLLFQCYLFYREEPIKTVYALQIHTDIDWWKKNGNYFHIGNDLSHFKYPNEKLLQIGTVFSKRELEIIKLIELGLSSEQIAEKLFVSLYTVNAHRVNILKKSGKTRVSELIHDLVEQGIL